LVVCVAPSDPPACIAAGDEPALLQPENKTASDVTAKPRAAKWKVFVMESPLSRMESAPRPKGSVI
jgi:hypothetical protein